MTNNRGSSIVVTIKDDNHAFSVIRGKSKSGENVEIRSDYERVAPGANQSSVGVIQREIASTDASLSRELKSKLSRSVRDALRQED